ncbi:MAG TPA: sn-glycerol-3-phosphate ABC transporter ATP-binding protein UgpC [Phycisphaerales bacterium]|nr:sn-glycerol-3-phosphate ABC transporter ATP-binding protein UgpC [Phycisphaerales bacterium]
MAQVVLHDVRKTYPATKGGPATGVPAVKGVSLTIADGEFVVLVGPSGCGKSTVLRMIAGLEDITAGTISIGDRVVNDVAPKDRDVAMVFQNYALYPHMTVRENMGFALKMKGVARDTIASKVTAAAKTLGIEELLDRKPGALSGGQRQRVAVGRAIVREPKVFLFDEPLSNLDAKLRVTTRAELKALHQRLKTTTIYVTHDQEEAMTLGHRVVVMNAGLVQQFDTPLTVYGSPANRFVGSFVGTPPMNFLAGSVREQGGLAFVTASGASLAVPASRASLRTAAGTQATLGVRPTMLRLTNTATATSLPATVETIEPLGEQMDVHLTLADGQRITARVPIDMSVTPATALNVDIDMQRAHIFRDDTAGVRVE